jgi:uncharacterized protein (DUF1919 family)
MIFASGVDCKFCVDLPGSRLKLSDSVYDKSGRTYLMNIDFYYLNELVKDDDDDNEYTVDAYHAGNVSDAIG